MGVIPSGSVATGDYRAGRAQRPDRITAHGLHRNDRRHHLNLLDSAHHHWARVQASGR
jgi:hypothetical protein